MERWLVLIDAVTVQVDFKFPISPLSWQVNSKLVTPQNGTYEDRSAGMLEPEESTGGQAVLGEMS